MLTILVPPTEKWDEAKEEFIYTKSCTLRLEHSLVSISKWESKWRKPFYSKNEKTNDEVVDYVRCMTLTQNVDPSIYRNLSIQNLKDITSYINSPMTATWFSDENKNKRPGRIITSELVYSWMIDFGIPFECQKWHFNRLLTLIRVCEAEHRQPQKRSTQQQLRHYAKLNKSRRQPKKR